MLHQFFNGQFKTSRHLQLFKKILTCCLGLSILVYLFVHIIFFDFPLYFLEEIVTLVKTLLVGTVFSVIISSAFVIADCIDYLLKKKQLTRHKLLPVKEITFILLLLITLVSSCHAQPPIAGIMKDASTGLTASYKKIKPGKILLVMNDEIIHHTDIPLGESFLLVNNGIKGLTVKDGKVALGCALTIKNKAGKVLLQSDDLFNGNDVFDKDSVDFLKCTVSTGKPMKWEEKYNVTVTFWDKYGNGRIENKVTIRCIDLP